MKGFSAPCEFVRLLCGGVVDSWVDGRVRTCGFLVLSMCVEAVLMMLVCSCLSESKSRTDESRSASMSRDGSTVRHVL